MILNVLAKIQHFSLHPLCFLKTILLQKLYRGKFYTIACNFKLARPISSYDVLVCIEHTCTCGLHVELDGPFGIMLYTHSTNGALLSISICVAT